MFCTACGVRNALDSKFCKQCGHALEKIASPKISEEEFERGLPEGEQVSALLERAYRLRREGDLAAAVAACEEALQLRPDSASAHSLLGQLFEAQGEREKAIRQWERVLQLNPGSIADRMKLDELRGEIHPVATSAPSPRVTMGQHEGNRRTGRDPLLMMSAVCVFLLGAFVTLALQRRAEPAGGELRPSAAQSASPASSSPAQGEAGKSAVSVEPGGSSPASATAANSAVGSLPFGFNAPPINVYPSPINVYPPAPPNSRAANGLRVNTAPVKQPASEGGKGRVPLPDGDAANPGGKIVIRVGNKAPETVAGNSGKGDESGGAHIRLSDPESAAPSGATNPPSANTSNPPTSEALGFLATGHRLKEKEDYVKAIGFYRRALPGAGDETGAVHQNIAICYQRQGDKQSARTHFEKAIEEYRKLEDAGKLTATARSGLRVCEQGIKACDI